MPVWGVPAPPYPLVTSRREPLDVAFVSAARLDDWLEDVPDASHRFVLGLAPDAAALPEAPAGYLDYIDEVQRYPDTKPAYEQVRAADAAGVDGTTYQEWWTVAQGVADVMGLQPGDRLLINAAEHVEPVKWLPAPLAAGASVVLCANLDPEAIASRVAAEQVTRVL